MAHRQRRLQIAGGLGISTSAEYHEFVTMCNCRRLQGSTKLHPRQLAVLKALWEVREETGKVRDIPSFKILPSEILLRFAESTPREGRPERIPKLPSRLHPDLRQRLQDVFEAALQLPREKWPQPKPQAKKPLKSPHPDLLADLRKIRDGIAEKLTLDPSLLAPKAVMLEVALTGLLSAEAARKAARWMHWQENLLLEPWLKVARRYHKPG
jgi:ribonuclease D